MSQVALEEQIDSSISELIIYGSKKPIYNNEGVKGLLALAGTHDWWLDTSKNQLTLLVGFYPLQSSPKNAAEHLTPIHGRNPILLSSSSMAEWQDPHNIENSENTTRVLINEHAEESDQVDAE